MRFPSGKKYGAKLALLNIRNAFFAEPSAFITHKVQLGRANQIVLRARQVIIFFFLIFRMEGAIDNLFSIRTPERTSVVSKFIGKPFDVPAIFIHRINIKVSVTQLK